MNLIVTGIAESVAVAKMVETSDPAHVLIVGGGIIGLTLAQALRKHHPNVRFTVFERDADPTSRGVGWGLTLHWALDTFQALLPGWLVARLDETFVDPVATKAKVGNFLLFEVRSGVERWRVPPSRRIRVKRESLRRLLMTGVDVQVRGHADLPLLSPQHTKV